MEIDGAIVMKDAKRNGMYFRMCSPEAIQYIVKIRPGCLAICTDAGEQQYEYAATHHSGWKAYAI